MKEHCSYKVCRCSNYSSNIMAVFLYIPIDFTSLAADILKVERVPLFVFTNKATRLDEELSPLTVSPIARQTVISSHELGKLKLLSHIVRENIRNIAIVNIGNPSEFVASGQLDLWENIKSKYKLCIQRKFIDPSNMHEIKAYIDYIRQDDSLQMIALWCRKEHVRLILNLTLNIKNKLWYWYSHYLPDRSYMDMDNIVFHMFVYHPVYSPELNETKETSYKAMPYNMDFNDYINIVNDKWISKYLINMKINVSDENIFKRFDNHSNLDSVYVQLLMIPIWEKRWWFVSRIARYSANFK